MRKSSLRRLASVTGVLVAAAALPLVTSAPAHATPGDCERVVEKAGYKVGPKVQQACAEAEVVRGVEACLIDLNRAGVHPKVVGDACAEAVRWI